MVIYTENIENDDNVRQNKNQRQPPSQHDLHPADADKSLVGPRRPEREWRKHCFAPHNDGGASPRWWRPPPHPAPRPLQSWSQCQRPPSSQQTQIMPGMHSLVPNSVPNNVL